METAPEPAAAASTEQQMGECWYLSCRAVCITMWGDPFSMRKFRCRQIMNDRWGFSPNPSHSSDGWILMLLTVWKSCRGMIYSQSSWNKECNDTVNITSDWFRLLKVMVALLRLKHFISLDQLLQVFEVRVWCVCTHFYACKLFFAQKMIQLLLPGLQQRNQLKRQKNSNRKLKQQQHLSKLQRPQLLSPPQSLQRPQTLLPVVRKLLRLLQLKQQQ
mgnify:CR=1 FL=1